MSNKVIDTYLEYKAKNREKIYLFKQGIFYIAINEDAKVLNEKLYLKLTNLGKYDVKVGFPISSMEEYEKRMKNLNINYEIIEIQSKSYRKILNEIRCVNENKMTQEELITFITNLKNEIEKIDKI